MSRDVFRFEQFSKKQKQALTWWHPRSPVADADGIIADGAIRSGKTLALSLSFVFWAMACFDGQCFGVCGKTVGALRRNVLTPLLRMLMARGYEVYERRAENLIVVIKNGRRNLFYLFGGKDERSQDLVQGVTLAGVFFDEVALMPESFVNQATGRCSVLGSKFWFNCNPSSPRHWFKIGWIDRAAERRLLRLTFHMEDNLSLTDAIRARYERQYSGVFYRRYVLGEWVAAEGAVYDMFDEQVHVEKSVPDGLCNYWVSLDYGTQNPTVFLLWGEAEGVWHCVREFYYAGRERGRQMTDGEYADEMEAFLEGIPVRGIVADPSAASFITELRRRGLPVQKGKNSVADGIRLVGRMLSEQKLRFCAECRETIREFLGYVWDAAAAEHGEDKPLKLEDHAMDAVRYFCYTVLRRSGRRNYSR